MARYKIYDNSSDVITPVGEVLPADSGSTATRGAALRR